MTTEMATRDTQEIVRLDPQALIAQAIEKGSGIETLERLFALAKEVRAGQAREAWYGAMATFQLRCPPISKTKQADIRTARGSYSYRYAPLDEILGTIHETMGQEGLSVAWRTRIEPDRVVATCLLAHALGHVEESGEVAIPIQPGNQADGVGANSAQRVGIAMTYAKRYSLLGIIGMAPEDDDDAGSLGQPESPAAAEAPAGAGQDPEAIITEPQVKRLSAIAAGAKWTDDQVHDLLASYRYNSRKEIRVKDYDAIVNKLKAGPAAKQGSLA